MSEKEPVSLRRNLMKTATAVGFAAFVAAAPRTAEAQAITVAPPSFPLYRAKSFGVVSNALRLFDVVTTASSNVVSSASYQFMPGDVGKYIGVMTAPPTAFGTTNGTYPGPGAGGVTLLATIASISGGNAVLSIAATASGTAQYCQFGSDDSTALNALVQTAAAAGGGCIHLENLSVVASSITMASNVSFSGAGMFATSIIYLSTSSQTVGVFAFPATTSSAPWRNCSFSGFEIDCSMSFSSSYVTSTKALSGQYFNHIKIENLWIHDTLATSIGLDYAFEFFVIGCIIENHGRQNGGANPGGAGVGIAIGGLTQESSIVTDNFITNIQGTHGVFYETQGTGNAASYSLLGGNIIYVGNPGTSSTWVSGISDCGLDDFDCFDNKVIYLNTSAAVLCYGIAVQRGSLSTTFPPGIKGTFRDNHVYGGFTHGLAVDYGQAAPLAASVCEYRLYDNVVDGSSQNGQPSHGIYISASSTVVFDTLLLSGNYVARSVNAAILFTSAGSTFQDIMITGGILKNNGAGGAAPSNVGILFNSGNVARLTITNVSAFDNQATKTQNYALAINASVAVTGAYIQGCNWSNNKTGAINIVSGGSLAAWISDVKGYNPLGPSAVTLGASPATYTAGNTPETLYVEGTSISFTKNSIVLSSALTSGVVSLQPGESVIVTYTTATTSVTDRR